MSNTYDVRIETTAYVYISVEADTPEEAWEIAAGGNYGDTPDDEDFTVEGYWEVAAVEDPETDETVLDGH